MAIGVCGIVGVGLMGGSLGLALRARGIKVIGADVNPEALRRALARGAVDHGSTDLSVLSNADLVLLCTPPAAIVNASRQVMPFLKSGCLLSDVGSIKAPIVAAIEPLVKPTVRFVGLHPMCGTTGEGIAAARPNLFTGAVLVVTPTARTEPSALEEIATLASLLGMRMVRLTPEEHDRQLAILSHLTYLVSVALTRIAPGFDCAGPAFRDATRVAMSPSALWEQILSLNHRNVLAATDQMRTELARLSQLRGELLENALEEARKLRMSWEGRLAAPASDDSRSGDELEEKQRP